jgi:hypothetical protein
MGGFGRLYSRYDDDRPQAEYLAWQGEVAHEIAPIISADGHLFLNVGWSKSRPWQAIDVALAYHPFFILQKPPITWVKSIALDASSLPEPSLRRAMHLRTFGHFVSLTPTTRRLNPC